ncbi:putative virion structural protein [Serratia phage vB_SmaS-Totoro]|nr:putative virion structural protein [Serratia phage vB_SmaS-Totoro]
MKLSGFFKSLVPNFERSRVLDELELARRQLIEETLPVYKDTAEQKVFPGPNPFKSVQVKRFNSVFMREASTRMNMVEALARILSSMAEGMPELEKYVENSFKSNSVAKAGLTYNKITLIRLISLTEFFCQYSRRVLLYIYGKEVPAASRDQAGMPEPFTKGEVKWLEDHLVNFARCAKVFAQPMRQILNTLDSVPDIVYDPDKETDVEATIGQAKVDPLRLQTGWVPVVSDLIWWIGSGIVEYQANRYNAAKEERVALELRLAQLRAARNGDNDAAQDRTIEITERRLRDLNYKLVNWEKEYGI